MEVQESSGEVPRYLWRRKHELKKSEFRHNKESKEKQLGSATLSLPPGSTDQLFPAPSRKLRGVACLRVAEGLTAQ